MPSEVPSLCRSLTRSRLSSRGLERDRTERRGLRLPEDDEDVLGVSDLWLERARDVLSVLKPRYESTSVFCREVRSGLKSRDEPMLMVSNLLASEERIGL